MTKDDERLLHLLGGAPVRLPGFAAEEIATLRKFRLISEQMKPPQEIRQYLEWYSRAEQERVLHIRIAHARRQIETLQEETRRQIETLQEEKKKAETELATLIARGAGGRTVNPASEPAQTVSPVPADPTPVDPPTEETPGPSPASSANPNAKLKRQLEAAPFRRPPSPGESVKKWTERVMPEHVRYAQNFFSENKDLWAKAGGSPVKPRGKRSS